MVALVLCHRFSQNRRHLNPQSSYQLTKITLPGKLFLVSIKASQTDMRHALGLSTVSLGALFVEVRIFLLGHLTNELSGATLCATSAAALDCVKSRFSKNVV
jgi:hypothetical protein